MTTFQDLKHLLSLLYIFPSLLLYFLILYIILFSKVRQKYSSSFYWIFIFSAINYIILTITYYIIYRFTTTPLFFSFIRTWPKQHLFYPILYTVMYYTAYASHFYTFVISINRFTIFILKTRYNIFWEKNLKYFLLFCVFGPLFFVWNFPFLDIQNQPFDNSTVAFITPTNDSFAPWMQRSRNLFAEIFVTCLASIFMNLYVIFSMAISKSKNNNNQNGSRGISKNMQISKQDFKMILYGMLIVSTEAVTCIQQCLLAINKEAFLGHVLSTQFILADISSLAPVWFLFITNQQLREDLLQICFRSSSKTSSTQVTCVTVVPKKC